MTNTGKASEARVRPVIVAVVAVWAVAVVVTLISWFAAGEDRNPDSAAALVLGVALPGVVAVAIGYVAVRLLNRRRAGRGRR
ncbi:hypothetical protein [Micromonospora sp. WMMC250]|uniref:hypothetical protein n=1 Tax=Micromonospora sp. WMMC250 TaxID=3014781 RepID=UPI0022B66D7A|nr:hypothetical protein [Micromonospora sp. WMMC250]MCZ7376430.1 hypothetical protein [Micromonospora sp. WMMC250]